MLKIAKWKLLSSIIIIILSIYFAIPAVLNTSSSSWLPNKKFAYGLDLSGGVSITISVNLEEYISERLGILVQQFKKQLHADKIKIHNLQIKEKYFTFSYNDKEKNINLAKSHPLDDQLKCQKSENSFQCTLKNTFLSRLQQEVLEQSMEVIRRRIDSLGNKEIELQSLGDDMILLQVPGLKDPKKIKKLIGRTAKLSFHVVKNDLPATPTEAEKIALMLNSKTLPVQNTGKLALINSSAILTGDMLNNAYVSHGQMGEPVIKFQLNNLGQRLFADFTSKNIGKALAIVVDDKIISAPVIREPILGGEGIISGDFTMESANELAILLRAGALPVPLKIIEERIIGPTLGLESIKAGIKSCYIAAILVVAIMLLYYKVCGLVAIFALTLNFIIIIALLSTLGATLTLPGIAGIVLTLGMAVDANVLIFERIKEELATKKSIISSIDSGYKYAFTTILDSNITTIAAAIALYIFGTGLIKGFAITLVIGILSSMFTSITITKIIMSLWCHAKKPKKLLI
jgi:preprotein translocase subunit SecD